VKAQAQVKVQPQDGSLNLSSDMRCLPCASKFSGDSQRSKAVRKRGPFGVDDREPRRVAAAPLVDHGLAENALELKAQPQGRALGGLVEVVALPLVAAVAQRVEGELHQQVLRLGGHGRLLEQRRERDAAHLDGAVRGVDAHQRQRADRAAAPPVDDGEVHRVGALARRAPRRHGCCPGRRALDEKVGPVAAVGRLRVGGVQVLGVLGRVERLERAEAALHGLARGERARRPTGHVGADGLAEFVMALWHAESFWKSRNGKAGAL
jgi:hypothetical protein